MTANDSKSYLSYLNKLGDQYNNTYLLKKIETSPKAPKFKVNDIVKIASLRIFIKVTLKIIQETYLLSTLF